MLDLQIEEPGWLTVLEQLPDHSDISAARFLTLLEGEDEDAFEEALQCLNEKHIMPDLSDLPVPSADDQAAVRLRREQQLVKEGKLPESLEENDPLRLYLEELAAVPVCGDVELLAQRLGEGDRTVTQQLTNLMLSRVVERSFEMTGRGVLLLDLIQEGSIGLWQGILSYSGGSIEAHCDWQIRWDLSRAVITCAREKGVGSKLRQAMQDYRSMDEQLLMELGRNPTVEEIAQRLHMTPDAAFRVAKTLEAARTLAQSKQPQEPEEDPEDQQSVENTAYFQMRQRIADLLSGLEESDAKILSLRFGLEGAKPLTSEEVGKQLGMTAEEVATREAAALSKLREQ